MMRKSGVRPAVKRSKLCCEMPRRAASGHNEATQLLKFAAASRIALAVIKGWPEAPSSPLQGSGALLAAGAWACAVVRRTLARWQGRAFDSEPVKTLSKRLNGPPPEDCARAPPHSNSAAIIMTAPVRNLAILAIDPVMSCLHRPRTSRFQEASSRFPMA